MLFDNVLPAGGVSGGTPFVVLQKGDYRLYFLKPKGEEYVLADGWFGQLTISRNLGSYSSEDSDPMHRLEADLKAGLTDPDRDRVLDSIRTHAWEGRADGPVGPHQLPAPRGWLFHAPAQEAA